MTAWLTGSVGPARANEPASDLVSTGRIFSAKGVPKGVSPDVPRLLQQADRWAVFKLTVGVDKPSYRVGEHMKITLRANRDCYVLVYYIDARGDAAVICPSPFSTLNRVKAGVPFRLVDNAGHLLKQSGPAGSEQLQVVACDRPFNLTRLAGLALAPSAPPTRTTPQRTTPPRTAGTRPTSTSATTNRGSIAVVGTPHRVTDRQMFSKSVEVDMREHVLDRAAVVAQRHSKGITPDTKFGETYRCFAIGMIKYEVKQ